MTEEWLPVVTMEDFYEVSNLGRVRGLPRAGSRGRAAVGGVLKPTLNKETGYLYVDLKAHGNRWNAKVNVLVAEAFIGPRPAFHDCCHEDGNRQNNRLDNLRWDTRKGNFEDKFKHGTQPLGEKVAGSKLTAEKVRSIRAAAATGTEQSLADEYGVSQQTINDIVRRRTWKHL